MQFIFFSWELDYNFDHLEGQMNKEERVFKYFIFIRNFFGGRAYYNLNYSNRFLKESSSICQGEKNQRLENGY